MSDTASAPGTAGEPSTTTTPAASTTPAAPAAAQPWYSSFDADTLGWLENRGLKQDDPMAVLPKAIEGHRNAEKLIGAPADQIIRIPKDDTPESWNQVYDRLGRPKSADEYEVPAPDQADAEYVKGFKTMAHQVGLTPKQVKALAEWNNGYVQGALTKQAEAGQAQFQTDEADLKKTWGAALEQNTAIAKHAAGKFGVPGDQVDALQKVMGYKATMELFHKIGVGLGEDRFVGGGQGNGGGFGENVMAPAQAQAKIAELMGDKSWASSYLGGDKAKLEQMRNLQRMANGG